MALFSLHKLRAPKSLLTFPALPSIYATLSLLCVLVLAQDGAAAETDPPYGGTVYIDKGWLTPSDPSIYLEKSYIGVEAFTWYDTRNNQWTDSSAYSYELRYEHGINVTASIHTDNDQNQIENYLDEWGYMLGQAPARLLQGLGEFQVVPAEVGNDGLKANGYTDPTHIVLYTNDPILTLSERQSSGWVREAIIHELSHATFGPLEESAEWLEAQATDPCFISEYARDSPNSEDVSETVMPYLMLRLMPERVSESDKTKIIQCIQARSEVLDQWFSEESMEGFPWSPWPQERSTFKVTLEEPAVGLVHTGVGNLRGWAVADLGIDKIEIWINDEYAFDVPYGGARGDVGNAFSDIAGSGKSGFSMAFAYSALAAGAHIVKAIAYDSSGSVKESAISFSVVKFEEGFIADPNAVDLSNASCSVFGDEVLVTDAVVSSDPLDMVLKWRTAEQGFEIIEIHGSGAGVAMLQQRHAIPTRDAAANTETSGSTLKLTLEEPVNGEIHGGVGNLRGWAVASEGIEKIEIYIDGGYAFDAPYGGARGDVGAAFPEVPNATESGFSLAFAYSNLAAGTHTIEAVARAADGREERSAATFEVAKFAQNFISDPQAVNLDAAACTTQGDEISITEAVVAGETYDMVLDWRTAEQGFEIVEIR